MHQPKYSLKEWTIWNSDDERAIYRCSVQHVPQCVHDFTLCSRRVRRDSIQRIRLCICHIGLWPYSRRNVCNACNSYIGWARLAIARIHSQYARDYIKLKTQPVLDKPAFSRKVIDCEQRIVRLFAIWLQNIVAWCVDFLWMFLCDVLGCYNLL